MKWIPDLEIHEWFFILYFLTIIVLGLFALIHFDFGKDKSSEPLVIEGDAPPNLQVFTVQVEGYGECKFLYEKGYPDSMVLVGCQEGGGAT